MRTRSVIAALLALALAFVAQSSERTLAGEPSHDDRIRGAVERALPLLEIASSGSADQRTCFTCHSQALPIFALSEARRRGFQVDTKNLDRQLRHTFKHLERGRELYDQGRGQGGGVDTAGYALWSLEESEDPQGEVIHSVTSWLLARQGDNGRWKCSSDRPPTESSHFTTTYLALRALSRFGAADQQQATELALRSAADWLSNTEPQDTEDRVFRLLSFEYVSVDEQLVHDDIAQLKSMQRDNGGWAQLTTLESDAYATATVLHALREAGDVAEDDPTWKRGLQFLLEDQLSDGSWLVKTRSKPIQIYFETGFPHRTDQFISTTATAWASLVLLSTLPEREPIPVETLPVAKSQPLEFPEADLSVRLMQTAHGFVESQINRVNENRKLSLDTAGSADMARGELRKVLGVVDERLPPRMEHFGDANNAAIVAQTDRYEVLQVRWPVFADVQGEGLLIRQREPARGRVILVPDADQTPEDLLQLIWGGDPGELAAELKTHGPNIARILADNQFEVVVPAIVSRAAMSTDDPRRQRADYTYREWIYRQAFHMGRHVIGYDIARVLSCVDWFETLDQDLPIGIAGYGEGGLVALHAAAIDTRIDAALVSGYFNSSDEVWREPIYRNVWSRLKQFGNAEVAALVAPRPLVIEYCEFPSVHGHKGDVTTPNYRTVKKEFERIPDHQEHATLVGAEEPANRPYSDEAIAQFCSRLGCQALVPAEQADLADRRASAGERIAERAQRTYLQLEHHVQSLVRKSDDLRDQAFLIKTMPEFADSRWSTERRHATHDLPGFIEASKAFRKQFREESIGVFDAPRVPENARTRKVAETDSWIAYDVVLDVYDGLFAWGLLVVPKDMETGQRLPVVVCQHGRNGVPRDTLDGDSTAYNQFAARLAERGFIVFSPHNLYRGEDRYRWLDRKANTVGCTLFSFIVAQHETCLEWLRSLPMVDGDRIAFYGLSYGGETAVRIPPILEGYCLSICSGDFNQWTRKVASTEHDFSFMNTIEWEMPYWNLGNTFDYAEMTYLMFPRPFMVERGHHDRVGRDQWVAHEFAKARWLYAQFGMADRIQIEFFQGGHSINGEGTFKFLDDWLRSTR